MTTKTDNIQPRRTMLPNRAAISLVFCLNGVPIGSWAARIPDVQRMLNLGEAQMGLALLGFYIGITLALPATGWLIARFTSGRVTIVGGVLCAFSLPLVAVADSFAALWMLLALFGILTSITDVTMNAQGVAIERGYGRPILSSMHAAWSIGVAAAAAVGGAFAAAGFSVIIHFLIVGIVLAVATLAMLPWMITVEGETDSPPAPFALPARPLWMLGLVMFCAAIAEGAMLDWGALYMRDVVNAEGGTVVLGLTVFSLMMTTGRLVGDWLTHQLGAVLVVRGGGMLAGAGLALAISVPSVIPVLVGMGLVGLGISTVTPLAFSAAGNVRTVAAGTGVAGVATLGYSGFLIGPLVMGFIADSLSLQVSYVFVLALMIVMVLIAGSVRQAAD